MNETLEQIRRQLREMWHRRWIGLAAAWVVALIAVPVIYKLPDRYEASARVFVDTESLLKPLLSGLAVQPNVQQQVALMSRTLISRPNVEKVVRTTDMDLRVKNDSERAEIVDNIMKTIRIGGSSIDNIYVISYSDMDAQQARKVVQALLTIFVETSLGDKRQDSRAAMQFLDEQIRHYEASLLTAENRLKEFRLRYLGMTREGGSYFNRVAELSQQITQAQLELNAAIQSRDAYKRELAGEQPTFAIDMQQAAVVDVPETDGRIAQLRTQLDELTRKYTDNHPDVIQTRRLIAELTEQRKVELEARRKTMAATGTKPQSLDHNPVFQQIRIALAESEARVAAARAKLNSLEAQHGQLKAQAKLVPQMEAELAQLNRDYDVQKKTYESLLARRESATMGAGVQDTGGVQFRVIDPPRVSPRPVSPNRLALIALALLGTIGAGFVASFVAAQIAPTFHDARSLRTRTSRPVLGLVSVLPSPTAAKRKRRRAALFAGGVTGLLGMFAAVAAFGLMMWRTAA